MKEAATKVILATDEAIPATLNLSEPLQRGSKLATKKLIPATKKVIVVTTDVLLATEGVATVNLKVISVI